MLTLFKELCNVTQNIYYEDTNKGHVTRDKDAMAGFFFLTVYVMSYLSLFRDINVITDNTIHRFILKSFLTVLLFVTTIIMYNREMIHLDVTHGPS